jgi:hypothetical protein
MRTALVLSAFFGTICPAIADPDRMSRIAPSSITCDTVRAYVARVGVAKARPSPERTA